MSGTARKKRVLFIINQFFKGGAETALVNLLRTMDAGRFDVDLLIFDSIDLPGSISLVPEIPAWVHVIDTAENEKAAAFLKKAAFKLERKITGAQPFRRSAVRYLQSRYYDAAISYGEWFSSALCARYASARRKYVWIHADMDKAAFLHPDILRFEAQFDGFLFASRHSMEAAQKKYPQLSARSLVVPNRVDVEKILAMSGEPLPVSLPQDGLPLLVTVANIREEKNHLREVEAMRQLFDEGLRFRWVNIGSLANAPLVEKLRQAVREAGLEEHFTLTGPLDNPYGVMRRADAVCVLSDHESWSMVITEAKALGVPVIATRTSGALEQIRDGENGILCGFSAEEIAAAIRKFLSGGWSAAPVQSEEQHTAGLSDAAETLETLLENETKKVLYVFDDINYASGARAAALAQARAVSGVAEVWLYSAEPCRSDALRQEFRLLEIPEGGALRVLSRPTRQVLRDGDVSRGGKLLRLAYAVLARIGLEAVLPKALLSRNMSAAFEGFDTIFVVSEASKMREFVSRRRHPVKVQWIHTDYTAWRALNGWTRAVTKNDAKLYRRFDTIVCLNKTLREKFLAVYPQFAEKTIAVPNPVFRGEIRRRAEAPLTVPVDGNVCNLITIGRLEREKRCDRLLDIAAELQKRGFAFRWYFVGDGPLRGELERQRERLGLEECVTLTGYMENPCPLLKRCSALVLFSEYEGTPVTIDEAKTLGVPVIANDVGGVKEMLEDGKYGRIADADNIAQIIMEKREENPNGKDHLYR